MYDKNESLVPYNIYIYRKRFLYKTSYFILINFDSTFDKIKVNYIAIFLDKYSLYCSGMPLKVFILARICLQVN